MLGRARLRVLVKLSKRLLLLFMNISFQPVFRSSNVLSANRICGEECVGLQAFVSLAGLSTTRSSQAFATRTLA